MSKTSVKFSEELKLFHTKSFCDITKQIIKEIPENFWTKPASSTGKYHPWYCNKPGGLYKHSRAVTKIAVSLLEAKADMVYVDVHDGIIAGAMLHDICKYGVNGEEEFTQANHPELAAQYIRDIAGPGAYSDIVCPIVISHMGKWGTYKPMTWIQQLVHMADYIASRRFIDVYFNI